MGWLIAFILLGLLIKNRGRIRAYTNVVDLVLLRQELDRLQAAKRIEATDHRTLSQPVDGLLREWMGRLGIHRGDPAAREGKERAWTQVMRLLGRPPESEPPWQRWQPELPLTKPEIREPGGSGNQALSESDSLPSPLSAPGAERAGAHPTEFNAGPPLPLSVSTSHPTAASPAPPLVSEADPAFAVPSQPHETTRHAGSPAKTGTLERLLQSASGWPRLIAPFLVQNIGWFISSFFFVVGSIFLVTYTAGFARSLIVAVILLVYTLLLIASAYQLKRRRPELHGVSSMLITLAMLLIPLSIAAAIRLLDIALPAIPESATGTLLLVINLAVFYWAAQLASGIMDRSLQGSHPRLFIALAAVQLAVPVLARVSVWPVPAFFHLTLLGLLGFGLRRFIRDWLRSIFLERRKLAYYAAGTLVYAALVSFMHLTWRFGGVLPDGYAAPFLMVLSGLLFYVDAQFKVWTRQYPFLSRFTFAVYGLSTLAVALCFDDGVAREITLVLGVAVYATVVRQFLTLPPLYFLLTGLTWLYGLLVLRHAPPASHFLLSLPGLAGVGALYQWAERRKAAALALVCFRGLMLLTAGLAAWSLFHAEPGLTGATTGAVFTGLVYAALRYAPSQVLISLGRDAAAERLRLAGENLCSTTWFYAVPLASVLPLAYLPAATGAGWAGQLAISLMVMGGCLNWLVLHPRHQTARPGAVRVEVLLNSGLLAVLPALSAALLGRTTEQLPMGFLALIFLLGSGIWLWQSLTLRVRALFYGVLLMAGTAGVVIKRTYFPDPSVGLTETFLVIGIWGLLWWLEGLKATAERLDAQEPMPSGNHGTAWTLLWCWPVYRRRQPLAVTFGRPLKLVMVAAWGLALYRLGHYLSGAEPTLGWVLNTVLCMLTTMLLAAYFRLFYLFPLPIFLGLSGSLALLYRLDIRDSLAMSLCAVLYGLGFWSLLRRIVTWPFTLRLTHLLRLRSGHGEGRKRIEQVTHWTVYGITLAGMITAAGHWCNQPKLTVLPTLWSGMVFLWFAAQCYGKQLYSYGLIAAAVWSVGVLYVWGMDITDLRTLPSDERTGFIGALLSLAMASLSTYLRRFPAYRSLYVQPLWVVAWIGYGWTLREVLPLLATVFIRFETYPYESWLFLIAGLTLLPLLHPLTQAARWRGIGILIHLTGFVVSLLPLAGPLRWHSLTQLLWAYGLWTLANFALPAYNKRWPHGALTPDIWPWAGLVLAVCPSLVALNKGSFLLHCPYWLALGLYLLLLLRNTRWAGWPWLAVGVLTGAGVFVVQDLAAVVNLRPMPWVVLGILLWADLLLGLSLLWRRYGEIVQDRLGWHDPDLKNPLLIWPLLVLSTGLMIMVAWDMAALLPYGPALLSRPSLLVIPLTLALSFLLLWRLHPTRLHAHGVILSLSTLGVSVWLALAPSVFQPPLGISLWSGALFAAHILWLHRKNEKEDVRLLGRTLSRWAKVSPWVALGVLVLKLPTLSLTEILPTLVLLTGIMAGLAWQHRQYGPFRAALLMALIILHAWPFVWVSTDRFLQLMPEYALQLSVVAWVIIGIKQWVMQRWPRTDTGLKRPFRLLPTVGVLALGEWILHGTTFAYQLHTMAAPRKIALWLSGAAALLAAGLLISMGIRRLLHCRQALWVYAVALMSVATGAYIRLLWVGLNPVTLWDTAAILATSGLLFMLHRFTNTDSLAVPLARLTLLMPLAALMTVPWHTASSHTAATLIAAAALYLSLHLTSGKSVPLYLAAVMINTALYLWIPAWVARYDLLQIYVVPAALSVLILLHLHRQELKRSVLNGTRMVAISALYASATLDVFLRPELSIFVLVLVLAMVGVILGIALRTRAFLWGGITFLAINLLGQLIRFYPDQRLGKGLVLVTMGAIVMAAMIWFNIKREVILRRVRIFRSDLETWH